MTEFVITPTNVDFLESIFRNPITGRWTIPILTFNTAYINPFYGEVDPLNNDPKYQKRVIDHFYLRLTEKWLYKDPTFRKLLKYFRIERSADEAKVSLVSNIDDVSSANVDDKDRKYVYRYIEKVFITKRFVEKVLKQYVKTTRIKWYDLFHNTDILKELFAHKLKKLIVTTIYELQDKTAVNTRNERVKNNEYEYDNDETSMWDETETNN
ncbi:hypothetical protein QJ857_gp0907 [Tupanvirus soda lake]|uniref:Uncharacterized protein n=2 Tax=Tupanvirus TaxID=2094720 RepID=A0A6N1NKM3_9VIRU|nr:hypothetical protein QJ857_gp0907 [Tupanvirus soda lake]QKU35145.1 hypothetical protein [Tupanvirus soda lake]